jgi:hypothetical protein
MRRLVLLTPQILNRRLANHRELSILSHCPPCAWDPNLRHPKWLSLAMVVLKDRGDLPMYTMSASNLAAAALRPIVKSNIGGNHG